MDIPTDVRLPICIERGTVVNFSFLGQDPKAAPKNRYFVVVNADPKKDKAIILVTSTTQIAKKLEYVKRAGISEETIVAVAQKEYTSFSRDCAFNCNDVFEYQLKELIEKIDANGSMDYPPLPEGIMAKIIRAIKISPTVRDEVKKSL